MLSHPSVKFSQEYVENIGELRKFLFQELYRHPTVVHQVHLGVKIIENLFEYYMENPQYLPEDECHKEDGILLRVKDFIAGMTDTFAIQQWEKIFKKS